MKIVGILLRSAGIVGIAVGISLIVLRLLQIPGNKKINRVYPDSKTERTSNKGIGITLAIVSLFLFILIALLLWML